MISSCNGCRARATTGDVNELVDEVETQILRLSEEREENKAKSVTMKDLVNSAIKRLRIITRGRMLTGIGSASPISTR
jgi:replicative DNA helicase